jgi:hypothetical protein
VDPVPGADIRRNFVDVYSLDTPDTLNSST